MLLAAGAQVRTSGLYIIKLSVRKGHRSALPAASIMIKEPISSYRGQVSIRFCTNFSFDVQSRRPSWKYIGKKCDIQKHKWFVKL